MKWSIVYIYLCIISMSQETVFNFITERNSKFIVLLDYLPHKRHLLNGLSCNKLSSSLHLNKKKKKKKKRVATNFYHLIMFSSIKAASVKIANTILIDKVFFLNWVKEFFFKFSYLSLEHVILPCIHIKRS